jgi:hypothetical protein
MQRIVIAIALCAAAGYVTAQEPTTLEPVIVEPPARVFTPINCTPPTDSPACADFHALLRANFTERELSMLFGAAAAHPEYLASYDRTRERYAMLVRDVETYGLPAQAYERSEP